MLPVQAVSAVDEITLELGQVTGSDWVAESVSLSLDWQQGTKAGFRISAKQFTHPALLSPLKTPALSCSNGDISGRSVSCFEGMLHLQHPALENPKIPISFRFDIPTQTLNAELSQVHIASGVLHFKIQTDLQKWSLQAQGKGFDIAVAQKLLLTGNDYELAGKVDLTASVSGVEEIVSKLQWQLDFIEVAFGDASGENMGEGLSGSWQGKLGAAADTWAGDTKVKLEQGAILTPFAYFDPGQNPISITTKFSFDPQQLEIKSLDYLHPDILEFNAVVNVALRDKPALQNIRLQAKQIGIKAVYENYVQPTQAESLLASLDLAGQIEVSLNYVLNGAQQLALQLHDVHVDEVLPPVIEEEEDVPMHRRIGLYGLNGNLIWTGGQGAVESNLSWDSGHLLDGLTLGAAEFNLQLHENSLRLLHKVRIPVLDGGLEVSVFDLRMEEEGPSVAFGGAITPISMERLTEALGWLPLAGKLSGGIPEATFKDGILQVEGAMIANLFNGLVLIQDLRLDDPFGVWPTLQANIELKNLDLEALTSAFSFGKITGKLEGRIDDLYLENWQPVSFDARFATPEDDDSSHTLSQQAIDNISSFSGGPSGALSRGFLSFFKEFGYDKLGVSCRLENGACTMGGVESKGDGFYLVKGGGLPRIDIIGFDQRFDWDILISMLQQIIDNGLGDAEIK